MNYTVNIDIERSCEEKDLLKLGDADFLNLMGEEFISGRYKRRIRQFI